MKISNIFKPSNRSLVREMVASDFKLRYQRSVLGYVWTLLRPLMMFGVLYIVFTKVIKVSKGVPHYPAYLLLGIVLWTFFVESTMAGMNAITGRGDMIRKVSVPKYVIVISTTVSAFVNFCLNSVIVFIFMWLSHVPFRWTILLAPILVAELAIFSLGVSFLLSTLYVKFRDFSHIWEVTLQVLFYAVPIIYPMTLPPEKYRRLISINPLAQIIQDIRWLVITPETITTKAVFHSEWGRLGPMLIVLFVVLLGGWYFKRNSKNFAEEL